MIKAEAPPPPKRAKSRLPAPPTGTTNNIPNATRLDLNFKVPAPFHRRFALEATLRGMSQVDLLYTMFGAYIEKHGGTMEAPSPELLRSLQDEAIPLGNLVRARKR